MSVTTRRFYLIPEIAQIARTSIATVRDWITDGKLPSTKPGRRRLVSERDLFEFLGENRRDRIRQAANRPDERGSTVSTRRGDAASRLMETKRPGRSTGGAP
ncbi:MAG: helix-turn-helix domain-containing protein [Sandaracinaceae bacterium]|nr:helix-turn-helix domain-containing protein [Sandaracinaceae bacterium]